MTRRRHRMPFGAESDASGVRFALWAPTAPEVAVVVDGVAHPMPDEGGGWRRLTVPGVAPGARYGFRVGDEVLPDPASRFQPEDVGAASQVVDPTSFAWTDADWIGRPWEEAVIYEAHVGTATPAGTFAGLAGELPRLADLGFTALELMPIGDFQGRRNWGYDGVLPYAPDSAYGTPDDLKRLVDRAHRHGIMVLLDVVYNHFGPAGNHLSKYAATFFTERHRTPWGAGLNFDGQDGGPVREFVIHNALYWLEEFNLDGLRLDAVHAILDDGEPNILAELARRARAQRPERPVHLVLENEANEARWLERGPEGAPVLHTAQWNDDIHHCWHVLLTGEGEAYYAAYAGRALDQLARSLAEGFVFQGEEFLEPGRRRGEVSAHLPPSAFVAFLQNHDQVGNRAFGDRLAGAVAPERLALARAATLLGPQIPMLFMGEEWGSETPFQFFVDFSHDPGLSAAVRDGRRHEFRHFAAFGDPAAASRIPDPTAEATYLASQLDPAAEIAAPLHAAILAETRALLALRHSHVVPVTKSAYGGAELRRPAPSAIDVTWRFAAGTLRLVLNLGEAAIAWPDLGGATVIWSSP
ncbi:MAG: malto-oligosyltrehalose trehalohydrolase, partial [Methylobacteriaceae bacterium]|nr:malto-oligosyltrehalose trehalohydrolase [Methylobacteriaceae bacterium]